MSGRPVDKIVADLLDAVGAASELGPLYQTDPSASDVDGMPTTTIGSCALLVRLSLAGSATLRPNSETNTAMTFRERCPGMTLSLTGSSSTTSITGSITTSSGTPSNEMYLRSVPV